MKNLKVSFVFVIAITMFSNVVNAQEKGNISDEKKSEIVQQMKVAKEKLALSPEQEVSFTAISKKYSMKLKAVKNDSIGTRKDKFKILKDLKSQKDIEMKALLSENQYKIYLEMQADRKEKMKTKMKERKNKTAIED